MVSEIDLKNIKKAIDITIDLQNVKGFTDELYKKDMAKARDALMRSYYLLLGQKRMSDKTDKVM